MSRRKKDPLRPVTDAEGDELARLSRSQAAPAVEVARARMLLAVAAGDDYQQAARAAGRRSGDAVSHLVAASTPRAWPRLRPATAAALRSSMARRTASGSSPRSTDLRP